MGGNAKGIKRPKEEGSVASLRGTAACDYNVGSGERISRCSKKNLRKGGKTREANG